VKPLIKYYCYWAQRGIFKNKETKVLDFQKVISEQSGQSFLWHLLKITVPDSLDTYCWSVSQQNLDLSTLSLPKFRLWAICFLQYHQNLYWEHAGAHACLYPCAHVHTSQHTPRHAHTHSHTHNPSLSSSPRLLIFHFRIWCLIFFSSCPRYRRGLWGS
jgi:hypothetical protein